MMKKRSQVISYSYFEFQNITSRCYWLKPVFDYNTAACRSSGKVKDSF
jgi:hypothetical protein